MGNATSGASGALLITDISSLSFQFPQSLQPAKTSRNLETYPVSRKPLKVYSKWRTTEN